MRHKLINLIVIISIAAFVWQSLTLLRSFCYSEKICYEGQAWGSAGQDSYLRPRAMVERKGEYEHPLGTDRYIENNLEGLRAVLDRLIEWVKAKGWEDTKTIEFYQYAARHAELLPSRIRGAALAKDANSIHPRTGLPPVLIGPEFYPLLMRRLDSIHDFVALAAFIPREAKGLIYIYAIRNEISQRMFNVNTIIPNEVLQLFESRINFIMTERGINRGQAIMYLLQNLTQYPELVEFLSTNRGQIIDFAADIFAGECIEAVEHAKALHWAAEKGLFDFEQARLIGENERQLFLSDEQIDSVLNIEVRQICSAFLEHWVRGGSFHQAAVPKSLLMFMLSEILSFLNSNGQEGFNPADVGVILQGDKPALDRFQAPSNLLLVPVRHRARILEERMAQVAIPQVGTARPRAPHIRLIPSRAALLAQVNQVRPIIKQLTPDELNELLDRIIPQSIHPMYLQKPYDMIMIPASLAGSLLVPAQIELLLDYHLDMKRAEKESTGAALESI